jgi:hypothetical protein
MDSYHIGGQLYFKLYTNIGGGALITGEMTFVGQEENPTNQRQQLTKKTILAENEVFEVRYTR